MYVTVFELTIDEVETEADASLTEKQDIHYLRPYIEEIERENAERAELESLTRSK